MDVVDTQEQHIHAYILTHTVAHVSKGDEGCGTGEESQRGNQSPLAKAKVEDFYQKAN